MSRKLDPRLKKLKLSQYFMPQGSCGGLWKFEFGSSCGDQDSRSIAMNVPGSGVGDGGNRGVLLLQDVLNLRDYFMLAAEVMLEDIEKRKIK